MGRNQFYKSGGKSFHRMRPDPQEEKWKTKKGQKRKVWALCFIWNCTKKDGARETQGLRVLKKFRHEWEEKSVGKAVGKEKEVSNVKATMMWRMEKRFWRAWWSFVISVGWRGRSYFLWEWGGWENRGRGHKVIFLRAEW